MDPQTEQKIYSIERPHSKLVILYFLRSLAALIMAPVVFIPLYCKYISLRYHFDREGVGASWGILFKKQVFLTYARIQDIHVNRSLLERWLGLGTVDVQTASGSASAELSIVGLEEFEEVRDFLYTKMRGARGLAQPDASDQEETVEAQPLDILMQIRDELRVIREALSHRNQDHV